MLAFLDNRYIAKYSKKNPSIYLSQFSPALVCRCKHCKASISDPSQEVEDRRVLLFLLRVRPCHHLRRAPAEPLRSPRLARPLLPRAAGGPPLAVPPAPVPGLRRRVHQPGDGQAALRRGAAREEGRSLAAGKRGENHVLSICWSEKKILPRDGRLTLERNSLSAACLDSRKRFQPLLLLLPSPLPPSPMA